MRRRLGQFAGRCDIVVTRATRFSEKARLFPGCTFVIGWDTAVRLVAPRYYGGDASLMVGALEEIRGLGCRFMVAGRSGEGRFHAATEVEAPAGFESMLYVTYRRRISGGTCRPRRSGSRRDGLNCDSFDWRDYGDWGETWMDRMFRISGGVLWRGRAGFKPAPTA